MRNPTAPLIDHRQGILIAGIGVLVLSYDALLIRLAATEAGDIAFWRGALVFLSLMVVLLVGKRQLEFRLFLAHGWSAFLVTLLYGMGSALFVFSITHTRTANTVVILSSAAFFAALFSWLLLRERIARRTWVAIAVAMAGVTTVFAGSMGLPNWRGDSVAVLLALTTGLTLTLLRRMPRLPKIPVVACSGAVTALVSIGFYSSPFSLSVETYGWLALMGLIQMPVASVMLMAATKYLPSPEVSLFLLIETILGPIWVWLVLDESVPPLTLLGGTAVLGSLFVHSWLSLKSQNA